MTRQSYFASHKSFAVCQKDVRGIFERVEELGVVCVRSMLFSLKGLSRSHHSSLRRSNWHKDLNVLMMRGESSLGLLLVGSFNTSVRMCLCTPCPSAWMLISLLVPCLAPLPKPFHPLRRQKSWGYYYMAFIMLKAQWQHVPVLKTNNILLCLKLIPPSSLFFNLTFCVSLFYETCCWDTLSSCSVAILHCLIGRLLKINPYFVIDDRRALPT